MTTNHAFQKSKPRPSVLLIYSNFAARTEDVLATASNTDNDSNTDYKQH